MASSWTGVERSIAQWRGIKGYRKISKISKVQKCPVHGQIQLVVLRWLIDVLSKQSLRCFATSPVQALRDEDRDQACQTVQIACPTVYYNDLLTNILAIFINSINHNILTIFFCEFFIRRRARFFNVFYSVEQSHFQAAAYYSYLRILFEACARRGGATVNCLDLELFDLLVASGMVHFRPGSVAGP